jgi:hypothetical protein
VKVDTKFRMTGFGFSSAHKSSLLSFILLFLITSCTSTSPPTPVVVFVTQEIQVTSKLDTPTPRVIVATNPPTSTSIPTMAAPTQSLSHEWVDYGGICLKEDTLPGGVRISHDSRTIEDARSQLLTAMWRTIEKSGSAANLNPSFSSYENFEQGIRSGAMIRGPFIPVGKALPHSDPWSFYLEDAASLWQKVHPSGSFKGLALDMICLEFVPPLAFDELKRQESSPPYIHLVGGLSHAIFSLEEILGSPRLLIKLYQSPFAGTRDYQGLLGFIPTNSPDENAEAANQHLSALVATLNHTLWGNYDGDGELEFGYGPANSAPLPLSAFQTIQIFTPQPPD